jgi:hypothetical protein
MDVIISYIYNIFQILYAIYGILNQIRFKLNLKKINLILNS